MLDLSILLPIGSRPTRRRFRDRQMLHGATFRCILIFHDVSSARRRAVGGEPTAEQGSGTPRPAGATLAEGLRTTGARCEGGLETAGSRVSTNFEIDKHSLDICL